MSKSLLYKYEKANSYVTHLEWSGVQSKTAQSEKLQDLIFQMSDVALHQKDWIRAADRLEFLLRITGGKFKPAEVHYRCGLAYSFLAEDSRDQEVREALFQKAHDNLCKAVKENPFAWAAYFRLAYVQVDLQMVEIARKNNEEALNLRRDYAPAKFNLAICHVMLGDFKKALEQLLSIKPGDTRAEKVIAEAPNDEELKPLLDHDEQGPKAREFIEHFGKNLRQPNVG